MAAYTKLNLKNKRIKTGDLLLRETPFAYTLSSKCRTIRCDLCFKRNASLFMCSVCRYVYYCDKVCQKDGWKVHKRECRNLLKISPRIVPDCGRMLLRLFRVLQSGEGHQKKTYYESNAFRMYKDLMSHYPNIKEDKKRMEHFESLQSILEALCPGECLPNAVDLLGMYGRICINSFSILDENMNSLGMGMYLGASVIDHSCAPNACATFDGTTLYIRALKEMDYLDWSRIYISYIETLNTTHDRQQELLSTYYFLCKCDRCLTPEFAEISAAACPNSGCDQHVDVKQPLEQCPKCGSVIDAEFIQRFFEVDQFTDMHLKQMDQLAYYDVCVVCLNKQKGVMHKYNIKHVKTLDLAFHSSVDLQKWEDALTYGRELIVAYQKYSLDIRPQTGLLHAMLAKLLFNENQLEEGLEHVKKAHQILRITHGWNDILARIQNDNFN